MRYFKFKIELANLQNIVLLYLISSIMTVLGCEDFIEFKSKNILNETENTYLQDIAQTCGVIVSTPSSGSCFQECQQNIYCAAFSYSFHECRICTAEDVNAGSLTDADAFMFSVNYLNILANDPCSIPSHMGPHGRNCLTRLWLDAGCRLEGRRSPAILSISTSWWDERRVSAVQTDMGYYYQYAVQGRQNYIDLCLGTVSKDCTDWYELGYRENGVFSIDPDGNGAFQVYCDLTENPSDGSSAGGWLVFQRRVDSSVDFYRNWNSYVQGFGDLQGNMWLGLDYLARIVNSNDFELHVFLDTFDPGQNAFAHYHVFHIADASDRYRLTVGSYTGTAGDGLAFQNNRQFSTYDADHDGSSGENCAVRYRGAWWYSVCHSSNLNGQYLAGRHDSFADGINWSPYKTHYYSMKTSVMKIRRL